MHTAQAHTQPSLSTPHTLNPLPPLLTHSTLSLHSSHTQPSLSTPHTLNLLSPLLAHSYFVYPHLTHTNLQSLLYKLFFFFFQPPSGSVPFGYRMGLHASDYSARGGHDLIYQENKAGMAMVRDGVPGDYRVMIEGGDGVRVWVVMA